MNWQILMSGLWRLTWQMAALAAAVSIVRAAMGSRLSSAWRCRLDLVVAIRLVLPVLPASPFSAFNLLSATSAARIAQAAVARVEFRAVAPAIERPVPMALQSISAATNWAEVAGAIWLAGAVVLLGRLVVVNVLFARRVARSAVEPPKSADLLLQSCAGTMGMKNVPQLAFTPEVSAPGLFGFFRPRLLLPVDFSRRLTEREARWVFLHELAHLRRNDLVTGWILSVLQLVHWFNPLAWLAVGCWRRDAEAACDQAVLAGTDENTRTDYGLLLLKLSERLLPVVSFTALGIVNRKSELRRRILSVARTEQGTPIASICCAILLAAIALFGLTDARGDSSKTPTTSPAAGMVTEVYDVRDLVRLKGTSSALATVKPPIQPTLAEFAATLQNFVMPQAWRTGSRISELSAAGQLVVETTPTTQAAVERWIASMRQNQCMVVISSEIISVRAGALKALRGPAATLRTDGATTAPSVAYMRAEDIDQLNAMVADGSRASLAADSFCLVSAPRVTVFNGGEASISIGTPPKDAAAGTRPTIDLGADGMTLDIQPVASSDRKYVTVNMKARIRYGQTTYGMESLVSVPSGGSLIARLPTVDQDARQSGQSPGELLMVVTARVLAH
jgi:beta-lactamase regulating signal transducer with metallopeptidase domain